MALNNFQVIRKRDRYAFDECSDADVPRKRLGNYEPSSDAIICARCNSIPWSQLERSRPRSGRGDKVAIVKERHHQLRASLCRVCRLLALIKPPAYDTRYNLKVFSASVVLSNSTASKSLKGSFTDTAFIGFGLCDKTYKACEEGGFIAILNQHTKHENRAFGIKELSQLRVDLNFVREAMSLCHRKHRKTCAIPTKTPPGLRVIDCNTRLLVDAPNNCQYVALSYVWGPNHTIDGSQATFGGIVGEVPAVIRDSISATISLGFRFLWVDRYCIKQDDESKHEQIKQMNTIYSQAQLTLIAAAGEDSTYGLPGVSDRSRSPRDHANIHGTTLVRVFPHTSHTLLSSTWATRAWTFQEGFLSNRRLILTDNQASFLCNQMHCDESLRQPLESISPVGNKPFLDIMPTVADLKGKLTGFLGDHQILVNIAAYSSRRLSYDSDALNACLGLLNAYKAHERPMYHLWGVPINISKGPLGAESDYVPYTRLALAWYHKTSTRRRRRFPSWSWADWQGPVCLDDALITFSGVKPDKHTAYIRVEGTEGRQEYLCWFIVHLIARNEPFSLLQSLRYLYITAPTVKLSFRHLESSIARRRPRTEICYIDDNGSSWQCRANSTIGLHCVLRISEKVWALARVFMDEGQLPIDGTLGFVMSRYMRHYIIILRQVGESYERIGFSRVEFEIIRTALSFIDETGNFLDDVTVDARNQLWLEESEMRTIKLG